MMAAAANSRKQSKAKHSRKPPLEEENRKMKVLVRLGNGRKRRKQRGVTSRGTSKKASPTHFAKKMGTDIHESFI
jgi:hypothetical protein